MKPSNCYITLCNLNSSYDRIPAPAVTDITLHAHKRKFCDKAWLPQRYPRPRNTGRRSSQRKHCRPTAAGGEKAMVGDKMIVPMPLGSDRVKR
jgi:hypothetical protein